jgi:tetratricopeptide (TPR) repeat protein
MQKALLSAAIALILVLVTALVGPLFVDWGRYRETFKKEIARLTGLDVQIGGPLDVRLLPVPMLSLRDIAMGGPGEPAQIRAAALRIELALGPLIHGEFVASDVALEAPEISIGLGGPPGGSLGGSGRPESTASSIAFDPRAVSIGHLTIENGRLVVAGAPNGPRVFERLEFSGGARSLLGPARGEGSVAIGGETFLFAIDAGRASSAGAVKTRLRVDTADRLNRGDVDGTVWIEQGVPRIAGDLRWSRTARDLAPSFNEAWRLSAKVRGDWAAVALDEIDLQYGAENRAVQFRGRAALNFRAQQPEADVTLTAGRVDLDRMLAMPATLRRRPVAGVYAMADALGEAALPPVRVNVGLNADAVTLADSALERVSVRLRGQGTTWDLDSLDLQAPGGTQVRLRGRLDRTAKGPAFEGEGRVEARDARPLVSWLTDGGGGDAFSAPFRAAGGVRFSGEGIAFDKLSASFDRDTLEGNVAYAAPGAGRSGRMSATLSAPAIDLDRARGLVQRVTADANMAWPRDGSLSLNVQKASAGGIDAKGVDISMRYTERALTVDRLTIDDIAGSRLAAAGSIDIRTLAPRGAITFDLDVGAPEAVAAAVEKLSAPAAAALRGAAAGRLLPASLHGTVGGDAQAARAAGIPDGASFGIDGSAGAFWFEMKGAVELPPADGALPGLASFALSKVAVAGQIDARDGRALLQAAGLDQFLGVDDRTGKVDFKASGRPGGPMTTAAQVTAGGLGVSVNGTLQAGQGQITNADLALSVTQANVRVAHAGTLPAQFAAHLSYDGGAVALDEIAGTIAGSDIAGRVAIGVAPPMRFDGDIRLGTVDVPAITAGAIGAPAKGAGKWSAEPFAGGVLGQYRGRIALASVQGKLTPNLAARNLRGVLNLGPSDIVLDDIDADMAGGHVSGRIALERDGDELGVKSRIRLTKADAAALLPGAWRLESGRLDLDAELEGHGRSPAAFIGSLHGRSSFHVENGKLAQLGPGAFDAVVRSVDGGLPIEAARISERVEAALAGGALAVQGDGAITVADGKARFAADRLPAEGADLAVSARYDLPAEMLDAKLKLTGPARAGMAEIGRPEIAISLQGPVDSPRRTVDIAALSAWLSARAAAENAKRLAALTRPDDVRAPTSPTFSPPAQPAAPSGPAAAGRPSPPPDGAKPDAAAGPPAVTKLETPGNPAPVTKPDAVVAARPVPPVPAPAPDPAVAAPLPVVTAPPIVATPPPAAANPVPAPPPADPRMAELDRVIAANPRDGAALTQRGEMFAVRGNYGSAIRDFDEAIRLRPQDPEALNNRCWARTVVGDLQAALSDCNAALQLRPRYADALDSRGMISLKAGQPGEAIADYDTALQINPKLASSLYGRGIARIRTGNVSGGNRDIALAKSLQPNIAEEFARYGIR